MYGVCVGGDIQHTHLCTHLLKLVHMHSFCDGIMPYHGGVNVFRLTQYRFAHGCYALCFMSAAARIKHSTHEQTYLVHVSLATHNQWQLFIRKACIVVVCLFQAGGMGE